MTLIFTVRRVLLACFLCLTATLPAWAGSPNPPAAQPTADPWYSTQLHIHSWSNHNGATQPASVQMHSAWANSVGLDVIWWTDHNPSFTQQNDTNISFANATVDPVTLDVAIPLPAGVPVWAIYNYVTKLEASVTGNGQPAASLNNGLLRLEMQAAAGAEVDRLEYHTLTTNDLELQGLDFTRPLPTDPVLSFDAARCDEGSSNSYAELQVALSWHNYGVARQQALVYRLVPPTEPASVIASSDRVTTTVPLVGSRVSLPLLDHALALRDGDDNAIQTMYFSVGAKNAAHACLDLGNFTLHSRAPAASQTWQSLSQVTARHAATYGVTQLLSWEQFSGDRHLNPYLPASSSLLPGVNDIQVQNFTPLIHHENGLVTINHPFGAGYGSAQPPADQEARVQALLSQMAPVKSWNADLIEIYKLRGRVDLEHHLRLWDLLVANGSSLCAVTTSDTHGGPFTLNQAMVAWLNAPAPTRDNLLAALRNCRVFFGDLRLFDGVLDLHLDGIPMGGVHRVQPGTAALFITLDPLPSGAQVKLVQYRLQPGTELSYVVDHALVDPSQPVAVDTSQPSALRVEVWSADGQPIVFSNRITINTLSCDVNQSGAVDIADVQTIAAAFGQTVPPAPAAYDLRADGRIDLGDVVIAGQCWAANH